MDQHKSRAAIVLCGGKSSRMGYPKWKLPFGGETMLQRILRIVGDTAQTRVVVTAPGQTVLELGHGVHVVADAREDRGPLEGIYAGLAAVPAYVEAAFVTSCDAPLLRPEFISKLFDQLGPYDAVVPREEKFHHPLAAVYRPSVRPVIGKLLENDQRRPIFLFDQVETRRVHVEEFRDVDPELDSLRNLNDADSYFAVLQKSGFDRRLVPADVLQALKRTD